MKLTKIFAFDLYKLVLTLIIIILLLTFTSAPAYVKMRNGSVIFEFEPYANFLSHVGGYVQLETYYENVHVTYLFLVLEIIVAYIVSCLIVSGYRKIKK